MLGYIIAMSMILWCIYRMLWPKLDIPTIKPDSEINNTSERPTQITESEVTVEDMILHDMNNEDDVYDIGDIDFYD